MHSGVLNVAGGATRIVIRLATVPMLIHALTLEQYGVWVIVISMFEALMIVEGVLAVTSTTFFGQQVGRPEEIAATFGSLSLAVVALATVCGCVLWLVVPRCGFLFGKLSPSQHADALAALRLCSLVIIFRMPQQVLIGLLQAHMKYGMVNLIGTLQAAVLSSGMVVVAMSGNGLEALTLWWAAGSMCFLCLFVWATFRAVPLGKLCKLDRKRAKPIFAFAGAAFGTALGSTLFSYGDRLIVGAILGPTQLAIYAVITSVCAQINSLAAMSVHPCLPAISRMWAQGDGNERTLVPLFRKAFVTNVVVALGLSALIASLAPLILALFIPGPGEMNIVSLLEWCAVIYGIYSMNAVGYYGLYAIQRAHAVMLLQLASAALTLAGIFWLARAHGLEGAVWGNGLFVVSLLMPFCLVRFLQVPLRTVWHWIRIPVLFFGASVIGIALLPVGLVWQIAKVAIVGAGFAYLGFNIFAKRTLILE